MYYLASTRPQPVVADWRADVTRNGMLPADDSIAELRQHERDVAALDRIEYQLGQDDYGLF